MKSYQFDSDLDSEHESLDSKFKKSNKKPPKNFVTIKDLCPEDKAKIGMLIKKLADEKNEKEHLIHKIEETKLQFEEKLKFINSNRQSMGEIQNIYSETINKSQDEAPILKLKSNEKNKQKKLRDEIEQINSELKDLLQQEIKPSNLNNSQAQQILSPHFKLGISPRGDPKKSSRKKDQIERLFVQNLEVEPTPSFLQSVPTSVQHKNLSITSPISKNQETLQLESQKQSPSPLMETSSFQSEVQVFEKVPSSKKSQSSKKNESNKQKKAILMLKIQEFEKIIERMNFSKDESINSSQDQSRSSVKEVYAKLLDLEAQLKKVNEEKQSIEINDQKTYNENTPNEKAHQKRAPIQQNEDDILIELLNSSSTFYQIQNQKPQKDQSSIYGKSFLSLVDKIENTEATKKHQFQSISYLLILSKQNYKKILRSFYLYLICLKFQIQ